MLRILAVFAVDWSREVTFGLLEKCTGLVDAARGQGFHVEAVFPDGTDLVCYRSAASSVARPRGLSAAWFRYAGFWRKLNDRLTEPWDFVWVRGTAEPSAAQLHFLANADRGGAKVVLDLPTYPTDAEGMSTVRRWLRRLTPGYASRAAHISRVVTLSCHAEIFGRATVRVTNGVTVGEPPHREVHSGPYRLAGLGQWAEWHGLDRILRTIAASEHPEGYELRLAGHGPATQHFRQLGQELGLNITWLPPLHGDARADLLAWADVGVGCLAIHRKGVYPDRALKHRQYAAAGLPFVATVSDPTWEGMAGVWQLPSNETIPNAKQLAAFAKTARERSAVIATELWHSAAQQSWERSYGPLWSYFADGASRDGESKASLPR